MIGVSTVQVQCVNAKALYSYLQGYKGVYLPTVKHIQVVDELVLQMCYSVTYFYGVQTPKMQDILVIKLPCA